jgi:hypothetical protein
VKKGLAGLFLTLCGVCVMALIWTPHHSHWPQLTATAVVSGLVGCGFYGSALEDEENDVRNR